MLKQDLLQPLARVAWVNARYEGLVFMGRILCPQDTHNTKEDLIKGLHKEFTKAGVDISESTLRQVVYGPSHLSGRTHDHIPQIKRIINNKIESTDESIRPTLESLRDAIDWEIFKPPDRDTAPKLNERFLKIAQEQGLTLTDRSTKKHIGLPAAQETQDPPTSIIPTQPAQTASSLGGAVFNSDLRDQIIIRSGTGRSDIAISAGEGDEIVILNRGKDGTSINIRPAQ